MKHSLKHEACPHIGPLKHKPLKPSLNKKTHSKHKPLKRSLAIETHSKHKHNMNLDFGTAE
jgi:hypothetical protein